MLVLHLSPGSLSSLDPHRTRSGWEICQENQQLWLRLPLEAAAAAGPLPAVARYRMDSRLRLIPLDGTLPVGMAPPGPWQPLHHCLTVTSPASQLPGRSQERFPISLIRSAHEVEPAALMTSLHDLIPWAEEASRLRLHRLSFAAATHGRIFVRGTPLPAVPGIPWYFHGPLALPGGWDFAPFLRPAWVEQALALAPGVIALIHPEPQVELIGQEGFVPLTLAALRRTLAALSPS